MEETSTQLKKLKILILMPDNGLGGAETYLKMIASYYVKEEVTVVFFRDLNLKEWDDLKNDIIQKHYSTKKELYGLIKFALSVLFKKRQSYDYIFTSHIYTTGLIGFFRSLGLIKTKRLISRESTSIFLRYKGLTLSKYKLFYKYGYKKIDLLICQTELMKNQLIKNLPNIQKRTVVKVVPNPINLKEINLKAQQKINIDLPEDYIVSAGRFIPEKGYDILINAFFEIKKTHPKLKLIILGRGVLKEELEALIDSLKLNNDVILPGYLNVYPFFKNAKLCVVSSRIEGFPNVLLQMMTQNNNVVSTTCAGGIDEITGIIISKTNDINSLYNSMLKALSKSNHDENRLLFDDYLKNRDLPNFIKIITSQELN